MNISDLSMKTIKTIEDENIDDTTSLLIRGGYIRRVEKNQYALLPLGQMIVDKLQLYIESILKNNKYNKINSMMEASFIDKITKMVMPDIKSYKDLPHGYYEIGNCSRDKSQIKNKLLASSRYFGITAIRYFNEASEKDEEIINISNLLSTLLNSFNVKNQFIHNYNYSVPKNKTISVGTHSYEGIDTYKCKGCGYNISKEIVGNHRRHIIADTDIVYPEIEPVYTKDIKTIEELTESLNVSKSKIAKTLLLKVGYELIAVVIRGDRELNVHKLSRYLNVDINDISMAENHDIEMNIDTVIGFIGPVELHNIRVLVDREITTGSYITGANMRDYHLKNVVLGRDFKSEDAGDFIYAEDIVCDICKADMDESEMFSIVDIDQLGIIEKPRSFKYKDESGKTKDIYGAYFQIDLLRLLYIIADNNRDEEGFIWPKVISPFKVLVTVMNIKSEEQIKAVDIFKTRLDDIEILIDDRNVRAGAKFFDSELWGIPLRITIGKKASEGIIEIKYRHDVEKKEVTIDQAIKEVEEYCN